MEGKHSPTTFSRAARQGLNIQLSVQVGGGSVWDGLCSQCTPRVFREVDEVNAKFQS